jgi:hypothetical protein
MTHTQDETRGRKRRAPVDLAGAQYTERVADAVKVLRVAKGWTHADLAAQMDAAGVPWTRETVVNLERARKRSLGVHELLALAFVLDVASPVDLIAPGQELLSVAGMLMDPGDVRAWCMGETGPLRVWIAAHSGPPEGLLESVAQLFEEAHDNPEAAARLRSLNRLLHRKDADS